MKEIQNSGNDLTCNASRVLMNRRLRSKNGRIDKTSQSDEWNILKRLAPSILESDLLFESNFSVKNILKKYLLIISFIYSL